MAPPAWFFRKTTGQITDLDLVVVVVTSHIFSTERPLMLTESHSYSPGPHNQILETNVLYCFVRSNPSEKDNIASS